MDSSREPAVAVIIPCHDYARFLPDAVESAVAQSHPALEIVVVDDGSRDETAALAARLAARYTEREIRVVRQENRGLAAARNAGIAAARAPLLLPLDADDALHPHAASRLAALFQADPGLSVAYPFGREVGDGSALMTTGEALLAVERRTNVLYYASMFTRTAWEAAGGYNPNMVHGYEDWDFWLGLLERGARFARLPEVGFYYRKHGATMLSRADKNRLWLRCRLTANHPALYAPDLLKSAEAYLGLGQAPAPPALLARLLRCLAEERLYLDALPCAEALLEERALRDSGLDPAPLHFLRGVGLLAARRPGEALAQLREAVRLQPWNPRFIAALADAFEGAGRIEEAQACREDAVEAAPDSLKPMPWAVPIS